MLGADREDLRKIWDVLWGGMWGNFWQVSNRRRRFYLADRDDGMFHKEEGNEDWDRLIRMLDMSLEEWDALFIVLPGREEESSEFESSEFDSSEFEISEEDSSEKESSKDESLEDKSEEGNEVEDSLLEEKENLGGMQD